MTGLFTDKEYKLKRVITALIAFSMVAAVVAGCSKSAEKAPAPAQPKVVQPPTPKVVPTKLNKGETPEDRIKAYFEAYKAGKLDEAFKLQPDYNQKRQPLADFKKLRSSMPITTYKVLPTKDSGKTRNIEVEYTLSQYGTWISSWNFEKTGDQWAALMYEARSK